MKWRNKRMNKGKRRKKKKPPTRIMLIYSFLISYNKPTFESTLKTLNRLMEWMVLVSFYYLLFIIYCYGFVIVYLKTPLNYILLIFLSRKIKDPKMEQFPNKVIAQLVHHYSRVSNYIHRIPRWYMARQDFKRQGLDHWRGLMSVCGGALLRMFQGHMHYGEIVIRVYKL